MKDEEMTGPPPSSGAALTTEHVTARGSRTGAVPELPGQAGSARQGLLYKIIDLHQNSENIF